MTKVIDLLINKIKQDYQDDIAMVVMMGSHLYHDTHAKSDLDLYFIPKTARGYRLGFVFIMEGIGFDFWPISWERIERIARREERTTSIITEGKILYHGSKTDLDRFESYRRMALDTAHQDRLNHLADDQLKDARSAWFDVSQATTLSQSKRHAMTVLGYLTEAISLYNGIPIKRGRGKLKKEILDMPLIPEGFSDYYETIFVATKIEAIQRATRDLIVSTRTMFNHHQTTKPQQDFQSLATGFYEELINAYHKIERAVSIQDHHTVLFVVKEIEHELQWLFADSGTTPPDLPDLIEAYDHNHLDAILAVAKNHQHILVDFFKQHGVTFRVFKHIGELDAYLQAL